MADTYSNPALRRIFASLVKRAGGGTAVVAAIREDTGRSMSEGTLTKISSGDMRFDWELGFRLEDMTGSYALTNFLAHRRGAASEKTEFEKLAESALKEIGEVPSAVIHALVTGDFAELQKEGSEGMAALEALLEHVRGASQ